MAMIAARGSDWKGRVRPAAGSRLPRSSNADVPEQRRPDGTFEDYGRDGPPRRTYYGLNPTGFDKPAIEAVTASLENLLLIIG